MLGQLFQILERGAFVCCMQGRSALKFYESSTASPSSSPVTVRFKDRYCSNSCSRADSSCCRMNEAKVVEELLPPNQPRAAPFLRDVKNGVRH